MRPCAARLRAAIHRRSGGLLRKPCLWSRGAGRSDPCPGQRQRPSTASTQQRQLSFVVSPVNLYVLENLTGGEEFWREKNTVWLKVALRWNQDEKAA